VVEGLGPRRVAVAWASDREYTLKSLRRGCHEDTASRATDEEGAENASSVVRLNSVERVEVAEYGLEFRSEECEEFVLSVFLFQGIVLDVQEIP
jgi:hypothetical protein